MGWFSAERQVPLSSPGTGDRPSASPAGDDRSSAPWTTAAFVSAWLVGLIVSTIGLVSGITPGPSGAPEWLQAVSRNSAAYLVLLLLAPVLWWLHHRPPRPRQRREGWLPAHLGFRTRPAQTDRAGAVAWGSALAVALVSIGVSCTVARMRVGGAESLTFGDLPPAYHDEYSYLFQAETFLARRTWFPTHPDAPQFFDQMHVLNDDGRYASRYFPGTGLWLAPFVAVGQPYWGHWLAGGLVAFFTFWSGRELGGNGVGLLAGLLTATAPGMALFSNLLLAHHPTLIGLSVFLYAFLRMLRTRSAASACVAGCGLTFAMLCRPMTAAGFAFPFGLWFIAWLFGRGTAAGKGGRRVAMFAAMGVPLLTGFVLLFFYNQSITGSGWTTPYAVYEKIYTPRQRYGFYNVDRGAPLVGPRVRAAYDEWAENLTPALAARNVGRRLLASWEWSLGLIPLAMITAAFPFGVIAARRRGWFDSRWWLLPCAIAGLHLAHVPYWFSGILHWHYVFESGPAWLLLFAGASAWLIAAWYERGSRALPLWWLAITACAIAAAWLPRTWIDPFANPARPATSQVRAAVADLAFSRLKYDRFQKEIDRHIAERPAIVFVDPSLEDAHIEYVVNEPPLSAPILRGRLVADEFERPDVLSAFPRRAAYWIVAHDDLRRQLMTGHFADYRFELVSDLALREPRRIDLWRVLPRHSTD